MINYSKKKVKTLTIKKVRLTGKWIEFWFYEDMPSSNGEDGYHLSSKMYKLFNLLDPEQENEVYNSGLVGRQLIWKYDSPNWEIAAFAHNENYKNWMGKLIQKNSKKPFKSGVKIERVLDIVYNTQSEKVAFQLSDSIIDCTQCQLYDELD